MKFLIVYEYEEVTHRGKTKNEYKKVYNYTIIEHENEYQAVQVFKQQQPHLKIIAIREYIDCIYLNIIE